MAQPATAETAPSHVPPELVVDFDFFELDVPDGDASRAWRQMADGLPPIFWTNRNGGHWVATTAAAVEAIQLDDAHFSMKEFALPRNRRGMCAPPVDTDPPAHGGYRRIISPAFSPKAVAALEENARTVIRAVIDRIEPRGECEFVEEVSHVLPITIFLGMMDLPQEDADILLPLARLNGQAKDLAVSQATRKKMADYIFEKIEDRRANPGNDVLSQVVHAKYEDRALTDDELRGMCTVLLGGGLDTVASMMAFHARFLATHPEHCRQLVDDPKLIPRAIDELIRRNALVNTSRLVREDIEFQGVQLRQDDIIQIPNCFYGLDPDKVEKPLEVDFHRPLPIPSAAFGNGPHRCPGAALGKMEMRVWLEEWLPRIPRFQIKPGTTPVASVGGVNTMKEMWLSWTPSGATQ